MNWLLHNPLANMYGPYFLILYGSVIVGLIVFYRLVTRQADTSETRPPLSPPETVDAYEMAYLRGGENEVVRLTVFELMQGGHIEIVERKKGILSKEKVFAQRSGRPDPAALSPLAQTALDWFETPRAPKDVFETSPLPTLAAEHCDEYRQRVDSEGMLQPPEVKSTAVGLGLLCALVIVALGGYKLVAALMTGHYNVLFLILFGVGGLIALLIVSPRHRLSRRGRAYLKAVQERHDRIGAGKDSASPLLLAAVGLFGVVALAGTPYSPFGDMFKQAAGTGGCGGGCGGSSCGGGGCGGGCGSGCGGCGGD